MDTKTTPDLMQMLSGSMRYASARQKVIADNIAHLDTPKYKAHDLKPLDFADMVAGESHTGRLATTSPKHFTGGMGGDGIFKAEIERKPYEVTPTGNSVVLEDQMAKVSKIGAEYEIATSLYKKFTQLYRAALGAK